ncbi:MAG TPA: hypothetical protein VLB76_07790, partial [Thermoanaerobaculia bacterium]|nr:hypothetical protein [Thermoanaerobaculia bacterium]
PGGPPQANPAATAEEEETVPERSDERSLAYGYFTACQRFLPRRLLGKELTVEHRDFLACGWRNTAFSARGSTSIPGDGPPLEAAGSLALERAAAIHDVLIFRDNAL